MKMIANKEFYQKELDLIYEILNKIEKFIDEHGLSKEILEVKDVALFRINLLEKILSEFVN
jgi:hypothetical protein